MATLIIVTADGTDWYYYTNETSVGSGGDNRRRSDIQLVQFFLYHFSLGHPELFKQLPKPGSGSATVDIDGAVGRQTVAAIRSFQTYENSANQPAVIDGKVSVSRGEYIPGTHTFFT